MMEPRPSIQCVRWSQGQLGSNWEAENQALATIRLPWNGATQAAKLMQINPGLSASSANLVFDAAVQVCQKSA
jgi:hypothetical protein